jgi:hypothetical protein
MVNVKLNCCIGFHKVELLLLFYFLLDYIRVVSLCCNEHDELSYLVK